ncbi:Enolase OS=Castellaniella defragrans OX=75697 GN=eno PE=3 SV=1 [Castellaniella defragrans]|uniref:Enolase n=1 Tax=Eoetvoesiella caeni TaxID=645616 RepID=A0A366H502_9BURK|nr:phosphopyruvate hydratase [Eoetvoesiella caeni]MCI2810356.1 phosphopyruvate hydratase [Eoetvoesiella caeni]NYT54725.1 phosphopyruvate hydratase [Eoetvoesiella caeni]RBP37107.1 enolase [Eoetvoesiella caeni]
MHNSSCAITDLAANEILDSRGNPALQVTLTLEDGTTAVAGVPSGASTGAFEAHELRDGDNTRFGGKGVWQAAAHVTDTILEALRGMRADSQREIDTRLIELDGTESKSQLGANAILGVSLACARAAAAFHGLPLFQYLGGSDAHILPVPMFNILNGGKHATHGPDFQEFKLVPLGAPTFAQALRCGAEVYHALHDLLVAKGLSANVGDEGGFVPELPSNEAAMGLMMQAIERAGYKAGEDVCLGLDPAATSFFADGRYRLERDKLDLDSAEMTAYWAEWVDRYPLVSLEDPLADNDWRGFAHLTSVLGERVQVVGDDLFVTNPRFLSRGLAEHCCNSILIKPNQIGTITETQGTARMALRAGYTCMVSHRSGETLDTSIADLAVALNCGQIKSGAPARGERVAKYNRLMEIERQLGASATFAGKTAFPRFGQTHANAAVSRPDKLQGRESTPSRGLPA